MCDVSYLVSFGCLGGVGICPTAPVDAQGMGCPYSGSTPTADFVGKGAFVVIYAYILSPHARVLTAHVCAQVFPRVLMLVYLPPPRLSVLLAKSEIAESQTWKCRLSETRRPSRCSLLLWR